MILSYLLYIGVIRTRYKFLEIRESIGSRVRIYQFALDKGLACLFTSHLEIADQVFPMRSPMRGFDYIYIG